MSGSRGAAPGKEKYHNKVHYDVLIGRRGGVLSISYCADDDTPWPSRGIQRVEACLVARVDGEPVEIARAMSSLDYAWHTLHVGRHLIDNTGDVFATWQRSALDPAIADAVFATEPGCVVPRVLPSGEGFEIVQVLRHARAELDTGTRAQIAELLFQRWLEQRRSAVRVEWFWGADEAADVPALQL